RGARGFVIDEHRAPAAAGPGFQLDRAQGRNEMGADDVEAFAADPARVGRVSFGGEFLRQLIRNERVLAHEGSFALDFRWIEDAFSPAIPLQIVVSYLSTARRTAYTAAGRCRAQMQPEWA